MTEQFFKNLKSYVKKSVTSVLLTALTFNFFATQLTFLNMLRICLIAFAIAKGINQAIQAVFL